MLGWQGVQRHRSGVSKSTYGWELLRLVILIRTLTTGPVVRLGIVASFMRRTLLATYVLTVVLSSDDLVRNDVGYVGLDLVSWTRLLR